MLKMCLYMINKLGKKKLDNLVLSTVFLIGLLDAVHCENNANKTDFLFFVPDSVEGLVTGKTSTVLVNVSCLGDSPSYIFEAHSVNDDIFQVLNISNLKALNSFSVTLKGIFLGRSFLNVSYTLNDSRNLKNFENETNFGYDLLPVAVIREQRWVDTLFIIVVAVLVVVGNVAMGCKIDLDIVYEVLRKPVAPAIGFGCQFIIMPLVAYTIARVAKLEGGQALGYFATGCSPGGGASNMFSYLLGGDLSLSITMTLVSTLASFAMIPLWLYTLGQYFIDEKTKISIPFQNILLSLAGIVIPVGIGILIQRKKPEIAKKFIKCMKPLFVGLMVFLFTVGVWINSYLFGLITTKILIAGLLLPNIGYILSGAAATVLQQPLYRIITILIETGIQNTGIPILLMKFSLPQPEADMSVVSPVMIATFTPGPLWIAFIIKEIYTKCQKRKVKENAVFSVLPTESDDDRSLSGGMSDLSITDGVSDGVEMDYTFNTSSQLELKDINANSR